MNILFVTPSYKPAYHYGGPTVSVSELAESLVELGHSVTVYTTTANGNKELDVPVGFPNGVNGVTVYYFKRITGDHTHVSPSLWRMLWKNVQHFDTVNLQSWWSILILGAALTCRFKKKKFILSPRGMFGAYSFTHQHSFYKKLVHNLLGKWLLKRSILHATSNLEWEDCKQVQKNWQSFVLYNLVNLPKDTSYQNRGKAPEVFTIGFLSRIDHKKGIELLFRALATVKFKYLLKIAGDGKKEYIDFLKVLADQLSISDKIEWCGWKSGDDKFTFLKQIDLFALISYNENFANAVIESLSVGTPVLLSAHVGIQDYIKEKKLGWVCNADINSIHNTLTNIHQNTKELNRIKATAGAVISKDFDKTGMAEKYAAAYQNLLQ